VRGGSSRGTAFNQHRDDARAFGAYLRERRLRLHSRLLVRTEGVLQSIYERRCVCRHAASPLLPPPAAAAACRRRRLPPPPHHRGLAQSAVGCGPRDPSGLALERSQTQRGVGKVNPRGRPPVARACRESASKTVAHKTSGATSPAPWLVLCKIRAVILNGNGAYAELKAVLVARARVEGPFGART
jgi:hypothetical protein